MLYLDEENRKLLLLKQQDFILVMITFIKQLYKL